MNPKWFIIIGAAIAASALGGILYINVIRPDAPESADVAPRPAPDLALKDYTGKEVRLADFRDEVVLVNAWASWCPFCKRELKDFAAVKRELGDRVVIVAVDRAEPLETAKRYSDGLGVGEDIVFLLDPDDSFYQEIGGFSMPETIFVGRDGMIRHHRRGPMDKEEIRRRIQDTF